MGEVGIGGFFVSASSKTVEKETAAPVDNAPLKTESEEKSEQIEDSGGKDSTGVKNNPIFWKFLARR